MAYEIDPFLESHPVFRLEELVQELEAGLALPHAKAIRKAQEILSKRGQGHKVQWIRKGLYASQAVMEEAPDWLPYAVASTASPDAVLGLQAALWLHLGRPAPQEIYVFSASLTGAFPFKIASRNQTWNIIAMNSKLGPAPGQESMSGPGTLLYDKKFEECPLLIRATTEERTLVDILDGIVRRPRKTSSSTPSGDPSNGSGTEDEPSEELLGWAFPAFPACWEALSSSEFEISIEDLLLYLKTHSRSKTTMAKVRFFLTIHRERLQIKGTDLRRFSPLPKAPHKWVQSLDGTLIESLKLVVPTVLIPPGFDLSGKPEGTAAPRVKPGAQVTGAGLYHELEDRFGRYGIKKFRDGQEAIVRAVLEGRDAIAILPTGAGKSLTYQFPSVLLNGPTLVISPLISLISDQVREARDMNLTAFSLGETGDEQQFEVVEKAIEARELNLLFASPESWRSTVKRWPQLTHLLAQIVIDEAHLINSWGQDFRFEYQKLGELRNVFNGVPILALTATTTSDGCERIINQLHLHDGTEIQRLPVRRPHLYLRREETPGDFESRYKTLLTFITQKETKPGIIYCPTVRETDKLVNRLRVSLTKRELERLNNYEREAEVKKKYETVIQSYHAGMNRIDREFAQQAFLRDECKLMVATVAFGMGVNKKNIRYVVHFGAPPSLENYVQEIGRAGRDAFWAECLLIYTHADWTRWRKRLEKTEKQLRTDKSTKGLRVLDARLLRVKARLDEVERIQRFVNEPGCLHRKIQDYFSAPNGTDSPGEGCKQSCDQCMTPEQHRLILNLEEDYYTPSGEDLQEKSESRVI